LSGKKLEQRKNEMQVTVYHHLVANIQMEKPMIYPVAFFRDVPNYNGIFEATNSIDEAWVSGKQDDMMIMLRSTSVGDLYKVANNNGGSVIWFKVSSMGFEGLTDTQVQENYILTEPVTAESSERFREEPGFRKRSRLFD